jgi:hypothetical protein
VDNRTAYHLDDKTLRYKQTEYMSNMLSRTKKACGHLLQNVRPLYDGADGSKRQVGESALGEMF